MEKKGRPRGAKNKPRPAPTDALRLVPIPEFAARLNLSRAALYEEPWASRLPKRRKIAGSNRVGYLSSEVDAFIRNLPIAADAE